MIKLDSSWGFMAFTIDDIIEYGLYDQILSDCRKDDDFVASLREKIAQSQKETEQVQDPSDMDQRMIIAFGENQYILGFLPFCSIGDYSLSNVVFPHYENYSVPFASHLLGLYGYNLKHNKDYMELLENGGLSCLYQPILPCIHEEGDIFFMKDEHSAYDSIQFFNHLYEKNHPFAPTPNVFGDGLRFTKEREVSESSLKFYPTLFPDPEFSDSIGNNAKKLRSICTFDSMSPNILFSSKSGFSSDQIRFICMLMNEAYELGWSDKEYDDSTWNDDRDDWSE